MNVEVNREFSCMWKIQENLWNNYMNSQSDMLRVNQTWFNYDAKKEAKIKWMESFKAWEVAYNEISKYNHDIYHLKKDSQKIELK